MKLFNNNKYGLTLHTRFNLISSWVNNHPERELTPSHSVFSARVLGYTLGGILLIALGLLLAACPAASNSSNGDTRYNFICANGTPADGYSSVENTTRCTSCNSGYKLTQAHTCVMRPYVCENGTPSGEDATADNITKCTECASGFKLHNEQCVATKHTCTNGTPSTGKPSAGNQDVESCQSCSSGYIITAANTCNHRYICNNGTASTDTDATGDNVPKCASCTSGYLLTTNNSCTNDLDGDGVLNETDVDDDNDGLIEIHNLTMLHNMRYNMAGTTYDDEDADTGSGDAGITTGAPTSATTNCSTATGGVYLCGYELTQDLTFDQDGDGKTFEAKNGGGYRLDSGDSNAIYFPVANDGSGGWLPVGTSANRFRAIFEGNGYTISYLAAIRNQNYMGMFGQTNTGSQIRNINLVNTLIDYNGSSLNRFLGGLVGRSNDIIRNSYVDATVDAGPGGIDVVGGLVGQQNTGIIIASYATGMVNGGAGDNDNVGGLVGSQADTIIASYATASVYGGAGEGDKVGGLVGNQSISSSLLVASYATGTVDGGDGDNDDVGGLVGLHTATITASYATGNVHGGVGTGDNVGQIIGRSTGGSYSASYGFGTESGGENNGIDGTSKPAGVTTAAGLTAANAGSSGSTQIWNSASNNTAGAWDFGTSSQAPALRYADYDGGGTTYNCNQFPSSVTCGTTLLPGQRD